MTQRCILSISVDGFVFDWGGHSRLPVRSSRGIVVFRAATKKKGPLGEVGTCPACSKRFEVSRRFPHRAQATRIGSDNDTIA